MGEVVHSQYGASSWARTIQCPGWSTLAKKCPPKKVGQAAIEGSEKHEDAEIELNLQLMEDEAHQALHANDWSNLKPQVRRYVEYCKDLAESMGEDFCTILIERKIELPGSKGEAFTYLDFGIVDEVENYAIYVDFKTGRRIVGADSPQMKYGLVGLCDEFGITRGKTVIFQVNNDMVTTVKEQEFEGEEIHAIRAEYMKVFKLAKRKNPPFGAGAECRDCPCLGRCPTNQKHLQDNLPTSVAKLLPTLPSTAELTDEVIEGTLAIKKVLDKYLEMITEECKARVEKNPEGESCGHKLVRGRRGNKKFLPHAKEEIIKQAIDAGYPISKILELPTPTQFINRGHDTVVDIEGLYEQPEGKLTLAPLSDARENALKISIDLTEEEING